MRKQPADMMHEIKEQMRGGDGHAELLHVFSQNELRGRCRLFAKITLQPGCSIGPHVHDQEEEIFYLLEGTAEADDNGTAITLTPGDALLTGGGQSHAIANRGTVPVVMMAVILLF